MKKFFLSVFVLALASVMAIGATTAYFSDTETSSANTFTAGTLDLKLDSIDGEDADASVRLNLTDMYPDSVVHKQKLTFKNAGTIPGTLSISNFVVQDFEGELTEPEVELGDTATIGELSSVVSFRVYVDENRDGYQNNGEPGLYWGNVKSFSTPLDLGVTLNALDEVDIYFAYTWTPNKFSLNDNWAMGDSMVVNTDFTLEQIH